MNVRAWDAVGFRASVLIINLGKLIVCYWKYVDDLSLLCNDNKLLTITKTILMKLYQSSKLLGIIKALNKAPIWF